MRKQFSKKPISRTIIVCGAEKTEKYYFEDFKRYIKSRQVSIEGLEIFNTKVKNQSPDKLLEFALEKEREYDLDYGTEDSLWCVFDFDDFEEKVKNNIYRKKYRNINKIVSNRCFELWYFLHYRYSTKFIENTGQIEKELTKVLGKEYQKSKSYFYDVLDHQKEAIRNGKKLEQYHHKIGNKTYTKEHNPYTDMHRIVEHLNSLK